MQSPVLGKSADTAVLSKGHTHSVSEMKKVMVLGAPIHLSLTLFSLSIQIK